MDLLKSIFWPVVVGYRSLGDFGDFAPFGLGAFFTWFIMMAAVVPEHTVPAAFALIAILIYVIAMPLFYWTQTGKHTWEFPYSVICNVGAGIIWMIILFSLFVYWPALLALL